MVSDSSSTRSSSPTDDPGGFPFPYGAHRGKPIRDVPQDSVWWALRPANRHQAWYDAMYEDNKRLLDDKYNSCSPGSEIIWFGKRYRGYRLDMVYQRQGFMDWCFSPDRDESGWIYRLEDLVRRLLEWREAHPNRHRPRRRRNPPNIENPVGQPIGPWNDSAGSAAEDDEYERDGFVESDDDDGESDDEDESGNEDEPGNEDGSGDEEESRDGERSNRENVADGNKSPLNDSDSAADDTHDPDSSSSSNAETMPARPTCKRPRRNIVFSDGSESDEEESEDAQISARKLGRKYRVDFSEEEVEPAVRRTSKRLRRR